MSRRHWRLLLQTHLNTHLARKAELQMLSGTLGQHTCLSPHPSNTSRFWVSQELLDTTGSLQLHMAWGELEKTVLGPGPTEQYLDANTNCLQWSSWPTIFQDVSPLGHRPAQRGYEKWSHPGVTLEGLSLPALLPRSSPWPGHSFSPWKLSANTVEKSWRSSLTFAS